MKSIYIKSVGFLLLVVGALMAVPAAAAFYYSDYPAPAVAAEKAALLVSMAVTLLSGILLLWLSRGTPAGKITIADGFLVAASSWISVAVFSSLPYILSGVIANPVDAFFESMSGLTTTGATTLEDLDAVPRGVMLWRCMTQGIGGMGILTLFVAVLPAVGEGGHNLFRAEITGGTNFEKVTPRISETAKALWMIYIGLMTLETLALFASGMPLYDAVCHSFTTLATGGFSPYQGGIGDVESYVTRWIFIFFMFVGGASFTLSFRAIRGEGRTPYLTSQEFKLYASIIGAAGLILSMDLIVENWGSAPVMAAVTDGFFQSASIVTTTGYATADFTLWSPFAQSVIFFLMFMGGCAGSTGGGIKMFRHLIAAKTFAAEFRVMSNPREVVAPKLQGKPLPDEVMRNTLVFLALYVTLFVMGGLLLTLFGSDMVTAFSASATCLGNVGPGLGEVGPLLSFGALPAVSKLILTLQMLMGRLELFGVLIFFKAIVERGRETA
ncbi:MAG: TrkH family potassium uptake protein [Candidatus Nitrospinota bacterium M3_3B_026]